ncbi:unnamed protein product [Prorocentrum cordatum]|uniref:Uncharacterized protein n=1 Tax=Prorocentrum cordatum TaxID=2364126 RepID=A0ABN9WX97_9DINO|nr:unnamed protein product [Polarella glacialis]
MASLAGDVLPPVSEQRPRPALAWAEASSVAPAPRQPSTPRMARGRPFGVGHNWAVPGPGGLGPNRIRRPRAVRPPQISAPVTLEDLAYMRRLDTLIPEPRMGSRTSRRLVAGAFAAPELLPEVELASGGVAGNQTSDIESTSVLSVESPMLPNTCLGLHGTSVMAGEAERPPCTLLRHTRLSGNPCRREEDCKEDLPSPGQSISRRPPVFDKPERIPCSPGSSQFGRELGGPTHSVEGAPGQARPRHATRSLSARGGKAPGLHPACKAWPPAVEFFL